MEVTLGNIGSECRRQKLRNVTAGTAIDRILPVDQNWIDTEPVAPQHHVSGVQIAVRQGRRTPVKMIEDSWQFIREVLTNPVYFGFVAGMQARGAFQNLPIGCKT